MQPIFGVKEIDSGRQSFAAGEALQTVALRPICVFLPVKKQSPTNRSISSYFPLPNRAFSPLLDP